jgi:hypothetical protein
MKTWKVFSLAVVFVTGMSVWSGTAQAQYYNSFINQREAAQQHRIERGVQSGALTPREAGRLADQQRHIQGAEVRMRADGRLNQREKTILDHMQNKADRNIYRQAHDNQVAYSGYRNHPQPYRGPHFAPRPHGSFSKAACRQDHGNRGRFFRPPHRGHRMAWHR